MDGHSFLICLVAAVSYSSSAPDPLDTLNINIYSNKSLSNNLIYNISSSKRNENICVICINYVYNAIFKGTLYKVVK